MCPLIRRGEKLEVGDLVGTGRIGKIIRLIPPNKKFREGLVEVLWAGESFSISVLPHEIGAAFRSY
jgi:hypothetical protein